MRKRDTADMNILKLKAALWDAVELRKRIEEEIDLWGKSIERTYNLSPEDGLGIDGSIVRANPSKESCSISRADELKVIKVIESLTLPEPDSDGGETD
jgi:hypothetical protein